LQLKIFFKSFPETAKCPSCSKIGTIRRSRARSFLESTAKAIGVWGVYKCRDCGWRGMIRKYTVNRYSFITFLLYSALILSIAYIINKILQKNFGE